MMVKRVLGMVAVAAVGAGLMFAAPAAQARVAVVVGGPVFVAPPVYAAPVYAAPVYGPVVYGGPVYGGVAFRHGFFFDRFHHRHWR